MNREIHNEIFNEGYSYYFMNFHITDNPFDKDDEQLEYDSWNEGWNQAKLDDEDCTGELEMVGGPKEME